MPKIGYIMSKETRDKISNAHKGKKHTEEQKFKIGAGWRGKKRPPFSEEWKKKIGLASKGRKLSEKTKKNISINHRRHNTEETKEKIRRTLTGRKRPEFIGDKHPNWTGGDKKYPIEWKKTLRISIRERDKYTCQICSEKQSDRAFDIHHIDYNKNNCNPNNLITLCLKCHRKTNFNREYYKKLFEEMIERIIN